MKSVSLVTLTVLLTSLSALANQQQQQQAQQVQQMQQQPQQQNYYQQQQQQVKTLARAKNSALTKLHDGGFEGFHSFMSNNGFKKRIKLEKTKPEEGCYIKKETIEEIRYVEVLRIKDIKASGKFNSERTNAPGINLTGSFAKAIEYAATEAQREVKMYCTMTGVRQVLINNPEGEILRTEADPACVESCKDNEGYSCEYVCQVPVRAEVDTCELQAPAVEVAWESDCFLDEVR